MNKKGNLVYTLYLIAGLSALAICLLIMGYLGNTVGTSVLEALNDSSQFESVNRSIQASISVSTNLLGPIWYIAFAGLILGVFASAWAVRFSAIYIPVFLILLITTVIVGVALSNAYEALAAVPVLSQAASEQAMVGLAMNNLPIIALIIGLAAIFITFAVPKEEQVLM